MNTRIVLAWLVVLIASRAAAFQINPNQADDDTKRASLASYIERLAVGASGRLVGHFKSPNHEAITHQAFGCTLANVFACSAAPTQQRAPDAAIWGVRWNDDPPFRMRPTRADCKYEQTIRSNTQPKCWYTLFKDAESRAAGGEQFGIGDALLYRSHFGDLQFLHSMASTNGEPATITQANVLLWAEFTWGIATQSLPQNKFPRDIGVIGIEKYFPGDQTAAVLLALGNPQIQPQRDRVSEAALGSLLHMVQDSFSNAHVERAEPTGVDCDGVSGARQPGKIVRFHNYVGQDATKHDLQDAVDALSRNLLESQPSVVEVSKTIVDFWRTKATWPTVQPYFLCVFALDRDVQSAGPGDAFRPN